MRAPSLALSLLATALLAVAACGDPAGPARREPVEQPVVQPRTVPPRVSPLDPAKSRPVLVAPTNRAPDLRDAIQIDTYRQRQATVDILWVVDNSGSMVDERRRLAGSYDRFVALLRERAEQISFRIGVTTTEVGEGSANGVLRGPFIDNDTEDPQAEFARQLEGGESRVKREQGLEAARLALGQNSRGQEVNPGFLRPEAALAVIFVSDEDDDSFGEPGYFARVLRSIKGRGNEALVSLSAISGPQPDGCVAPGEEQLFGARAEPAERYAALVSATGGAFGSICEDFVPALEAVVGSVRTLRRSFPLSLAPDLETLRVKVCPAGTVTCDDAFLVPRDPANGWDYREAIQAVVFAAAHPPPPGSLVRIEYALAPDGSSP